MMLSNSLDLGGCGEDVAYPLPKAAKPVYAKQPTRLPCLVVYVKFQFVYTTKSTLGSQLLLASTSFHVQW